MNISSYGIALIKEFEGFSAQAYRCPAGKWTVGYGHLIGADSLHGAVTEAQAEILLLQDLVPVEAAINRLVTAALTQKQFDALCALIYNIGVGAFARSSLLKALNMPMRSMADLDRQWRRWCYANGQKLAGLEARRCAEFELFSQA